MFIVYHPSIDRSVNRSVSQSIGQSIDRSVNRSVLCFFILFVLFICFCREGDSRSTGALERRSTEARVRGLVCRKQEMWTQLLSMFFGLLGIWLVVQWAIVRFRMRAVEDTELVLGVTQRLGRSYTVEMIDAPSISGSVNFLMQSRDRRLLITMPARKGADAITLSIDVSWLGRWNLKDSVKRVYVDFWDKRAEVEKYGAGAAIIESKKDNRPFS